MNAQALYQAGRLDEAVQALGSTLRADPANVRARTFLFELLCFAGEFERAAKQLDIIADSSKEAGMGALLYRSALHGEKIRQQMFQSNSVTSPNVGAPVSGSLNGQPFRSIADADARLGPRLEVFAAGQYTLIPFAQLAEVHLEEPKRLRDLLWAPARVKAGPKFRDFEFGELLVPVVAPLSWHHPDDQVRLGRAIEWDAAADGSEVPLGPKMLQVDEELVPMLDVRDLVIDSTASA
ncbi:MAG: type VI secretion system accessory protein TagJ [Longimicrobiales bacterium]